MTRKARRCSAVEAPPASDGVRSAPDVLHMMVELAARFFCTQCVGMASAGRAVLAACESGCHRDDFAAGMTSDTATSLLERFRCARPGMPAGAVVFAGALQRLACAMFWVVFCCLACPSCKSTSRSSPSISDTRRIVSLSPALTETLFVLGFDAEVVGVSDYCHEPPAVETRPRVGTIFSPRFEAIVQTRPTLLVSERIAGTRIEDLEKLAKTETFPWLSFDDVMQSTHALGQLLDRVPAAEHLVENYQRVLDVTPVPSPPRVLLALAHVPGQLSEIWFIRRNSLHGRALEAAGATNAITRDVFGPPRVGIEEVIALDPDAIVVVEPVAEAHLELLQDWRRIAALKAVQNGRLSLIAAPELDVPGPRIVRFVSRLREAIAAMRLGDTTTDRAHGAALEKGRTP